MPYIIQTGIQTTDSGTGFDGVAVATLDEAREAAREALVSREWRTFAEAARATEAGEEIRTLPEAGGTIGPLPDGYVIDVRKVEWEELHELSSCSIPSHASNREHILDAYNQQ